MLEVSPLVSVVIASYNYGDLIEKRIESFLNQTYENIEITVLDDCSTDNSRDVIEKFRSNNRVRIIYNNENLGWIKNSNLGISVSKGEYVLFGNCDDIASRDLIENLVRPLIEDTLVGVSFCESELIDYFGNQIGSDRESRDRKFIHSTLSDCRIERIEMASFLSHSCVIPNLSAAMFRREALALTEGFPSRYSICSDWNLFIELSLNWDFFYIRKPLNKFRQHKKNVRSSVKESDLSRQIIELLVETSLDDRLKFRVRRRFRERSFVLFLLHFVVQKKKAIDLRCMFQISNLRDLQMIVCATFTAAFKLFTIFVTYRQRKGKLQK
jgi:glycosyltransferase involved in cell wall biosynthesis